MAVVHFYEKPGCANNKRQRQRLLDAGHIVFVHDLLQQPWAENRTKLRSFFGDLPVADWFNRSAPSIKNGELVPEILDENHAIALMITEPLLIRRPLIEEDGRRCAGFNTGLIEELLSESGLDSNLNECPRHDQSAECRP